MEACSMIQLAAWWNNCCKQLQKSATYTRSNSVIWKHALWFCSLPAGTDTPTTVATVANYKKSTISKIIWSIQRSCGISVNVGLLQNMYTRCYLHLMLQFAQLLELISLIRNTWCCNCCTGYYLLLPKCVQTITRTKSSSNLKILEAFN